MKYFIIIATLSFPLHAQNYIRIHNDLLQTQKQSLVTTPSFSDNAVGSEHKKSAGLAVLYSILLPGMGEWYADGNIGSGKYSLIAEGSLWLTYGSFQQYGTWLREDARRFAVNHAGASIDGKDDQFFVNVGNFNDTYEYNDKKLRDREKNLVYETTGSFFWKWDADESRTQFKSIRISSEKVFNNSRFVFGALLINRIISAVNAARLIRQYNKNLDEELGSWWLESSLIGGAQLPEGIQLSILHRF